MKNETPSEVCVYMADNGFWWPDVALALGHPVGQPPSPWQPLYLATPHPYCDQSIATRLIRCAFWHGIACEPVSMRSLKHLVRTRRRKNRTEKRSARRGLGPFRRM